MDAPRTGGEDRPDFKTWIVDTSVGTRASGSRVTGSTFWVGSGRVGSRVSVKKARPSLLTRIWRYKSVLSVSVVLKV